MCVTNEWVLFQSLIPVVMSGIIAVYGLVIAVLIAGDVSPESSDLFSYAEFYQLIPSLVLQS